MSGPALLSDLDGVLVDSSASVERAWRRWTAAHGIAYEAIAGRFHGIPAATTIAQVAPHLDAAAEGRSLNGEQADDTDGVVALPGAAALLSGVYGDAVAVVTSCDERLARSRLSAAGLAAPPLLVTSDRVARGKPDPEGYALAAQGLARDPADCVVLEDAPAGIAAGKSAGMRVVALATTHAWEELRQADDVIADLRELSRVIGR